MKTVNKKCLMSSTHIRKAFNNKHSTFRIIKALSIKHSTFNIILLFIIGLGLNTSINAQQRVLTLQQAVDEALKNNGNIKSANYSIDLQTALRRSAVNIDKTNITISQGQINSINYDNI